MRASERLRINALVIFKTRNVNRPRRTVGREKERYKRYLGNWICIKSGISHPSCGQVSAAVKTASISAFHSAGLDNVDDGGGGMGETSSALRLLE
jgi:hypothetical protein